MTQRAAQVATDFSAGTLSEEDRDVFLGGRGLTAETEPDEAIRRRAEWPDRDILEAMEVGLG